MKTRVIGFESSCDETAVAILEADEGGALTVLSSVVASQIDTHRLYGGVVPEIASRAHIDAISSITYEALERAGFLPLARERGLAGAIVAFRDKTTLSREEWGTLASFAERVGESYTDEALSLCAYTERELAEALSHRRAEAPARRRVGQSLVIFGGLSLLLLFG